VNLAARRLFAVLLGCVVVMTLSGYFLKAQCIGNYNTTRDKNLCSNDIQVLYLDRGMHEHPFPYIHGALKNHQLVGGALEYPVLTGLFAWFPALVVHNDGAYLQLSALLLAPFSILSVWLLGKMVRYRALLYALSPSLVWYSFHNWDLLVVAATTAAMYTWWQRRYVWCGVWLAVGASLKFWPLFFVLPLLLDRLAARDRQSALTSVGAFAGASLAINVFFVVASPRGWYAPFAFQKERAADITSNSIWYWGLPHLTTKDLNTLVPVLLVLGTVGACAFGWWRAQREGGVFPFVQVCAAILAIFLLTNKAHSPQYALWLLPFFCLLRLRWGWWATYMVLDACMYIGVFRWYYALETPAVPDYGLPYQALALGVWGRAAMLVLLIGVFLAAKPAFTTVQVEPDPVEPAPAYASSSN
jgi:uncharacterized membrane protein